MLVKGGENPKCPVAVLAPLLWKRLKGTTHPPCILLQAPARYCLKPHSSGSMELVGRQEKDPGLQVDSGNRVQSLGAPQVQGARCGESQSLSLPAGLGLHLHAAPSTFHQRRMGCWGRASVQQSFLKLCGEKGVG